MVTAGMFEEVDVEDAKSKKEIVSVQWYLRENIAIWGARDGAVERALSSHQCGLGSNASVNTICGLSLLLVLSLAPRGFPLGTPVFPSP